MTTTSATTTSATTDLEARLAAARPGLLDLARALVDDDPTPDLLAGALDAIGSMATVMAAEVRGEEALR